MNIDYDNPENEEKWCIERQNEVADYLKEQGVNHGRIGEWPAWHIAPYASIWAIESSANPDRVGWWVICGDLPTDYISADVIKDPRAAMHSFANRWSEVAEYMGRNEPHPTIRIGTPEQWPTLVEILQARAKILATWSNDDSIWEEMGL